MDLPDFLRQVLPSSGHYALFLAKSKQHIWHTTIEDLANDITQHNANGHHVYYALASYAEPTKRKRDNVQHIKTIALDIDCGNGKLYQTPKQGAAGLAQFLQTFDLPQPVIVFSGNGLHCYWPLDEDLTFDEWYPTAAAIKEAALSSDFYIDEVVTTDIARILRPITTINRKKGCGKEVRLLRPAPTVSITDLRLGVQDYLPEKYAKPARPTSQLLANLQSTSSLPPAVPDKLLSKCRQIRWAVNHQDQVSEPLWYVLLGVAAYCHDPEETAVTWSEGHPGFSEAATLRKLDQWREATTGPATCDLFESRRPGGCDGCPHHNNIATPVRLAAAGVAVDSSSQIPVPFPFKLTQQGIVLKTEEEELPVCDFEIIPRSYGRDESLGYEVTRFEWNRPHVGWTELLLRQALLTDQHRDFATTIADQGIVLPNRDQTWRFQTMLRAYMDQLKKAQAMTNLYATMGWKEDYSQFVLGDRIFRREPSGTVTEQDTQLAKSANRLGAELYGTSGDLPTWSKITSLFEKAKLHAHIFSLGLGFAAPMFEFSGIKGITVSLYGETGSGKTLAQYLQQSIYGNPERLHFAAKFTLNSLFSRMGLYANLPMTIDEVTLLDDKDVGDFAYWVTQGRDKARLNRNAEEREARTWAMPVTVSTNQSLASKLMAGGNETDAQMVRILELTVNRNKMFSGNSNVGKQLYTMLMDNYGHAGHEWLRYLVSQDSRQMVKDISEARDSFARRYKVEFAGPERFWEQTIVLVDLALNRARECGLIDIDHTESINWVLRQLDVTRTSYKENRMDAFDVLTEFCNDQADLSVSVSSGDVGSDVVYPDKSYAGEIRLRFELERATGKNGFVTGTAYIDKQYFKRWLSKRRLDYNTILGELRTENALAKGPRSGRMSLGKGTASRIPPTPVVALHLSHPRLLSILGREETRIEDLTMGQMRAV